MCVYSPEDMVVCFRRALSKLARESQSGTNIDLNVALEQVSLQVDRIQRLFDEVPLVSA